VKKLVGFAAMGEGLAGKRASSGAVERIRSFIEGGGMAVGSRLPGERELSERLGISRGSVREALRELEVVGLVEVRARSGTYVKDPSRDMLRISLRQWLVSHEESVRQIFELRELIEPGAAALAARRAEASDLAALRQSLVEMEDCIERENLVGAILSDAWFHHAITRAARNAYLTELMDDVVHALEESRKASLRVPDQSKRALAGHRRIYEAIAAGDESAAASAMSQHLKDAWFHIRREIESSRAEAE
jgi:GntR family transcriptional repressor for pyruvate dehydrogenase complex